MRTRTQVLRFYAYFKEGIGERRDENMRVRKCTLYYYLSDGTIHIGVRKFNSTSGMRNMKEEKHSDSRNLEMKYNLHTGLSESKMNSQ